MADLARVFVRLYLLFIVVSKLLLPHEVIGSRSVLAFQLVDDVAGVNILGDQGDDDSSLQLGQLAPDKLGELV